jgi:hypothetical protein
MSGRHDRTPPRLGSRKNPALGKAIPYGVNDLANNEGWVSVHDQ